MLMAEEAALQAEDGPDESRVPAERDEAAVSFLMSVKGRLMA